MEVGGERENNVSRRVEEHEYSSLSNGTPYPAHGTDPPARPYGTDPAARPHRTDITTPSVSLSFRISSVFDFRFLNLINIFVEPNLGPSYEKRC